MQELLVNGTQPLGSFGKGFGQDRAGGVYVIATQVTGPTGTTGRVLKLPGRVLIAPLARIASVTKTEEARSPAPCLFPKPLDPHQPGVHQTGAGPIASTMLGPTQSGR